MQIKTIAKWTGFGILGAYLYEKIVKPKILDKIGA